MNEMDYWITQFRVQMQKLCLPEDRNTGRAEIGEKRGRANLNGVRRPKGKPNGLETLSRALLLVKKHSETWVQLNGPKWRLPDRSWSPKWSPLHQHARKHTWKWSRPLIPCWLYPRVTMDPSGEHKDWWGPSNRWRLIQFQSNSIPHLIWTDD